MLSNLVRMGTNALLFVEALELLHVLAGQVKVKNLAIFLDPFAMDRFWNSDHPKL